MKNYNDNHITKLLYDIAIGESENGAPVSIETQRRKEITLLETLQFLASHNYLKRPYKIVDQLERIINEKSGTIRAEVFVKEPLTNKHKLELISALKTSLNTEHVIIKEQIDQRIIGGLKIKVGELVLDATLRSKLNKLVSNLHE